MYFNKIWEDDLKTPIISSRYHNNYLSDGCWSPTRPGLFFLTRRDGWLDVWDYYFRQNEIALSHKVSDFPLSCLKINFSNSISQNGTSNTDNGKFCAVGDVQEIITLLKLSKSLYKPQNEERNIINEIFEREKKREDQLKRQRLENEAKKNLKMKEKEVKTKVLTSDKFDKKRRRN